MHDIKTTSEEPGSTTADGADAAERGVLAADPVALSYSGDGELVVLLVQRRWEPGHGLWALPGGHLDPGELDRDAAVRECREETGVQLDPSQMVEVGSWRRPGRDPRARVVSWAWAQMLDHTPVVTPDYEEVLDAAWLRVTDVLATPAAIAIPDHLEMITAAVAKLGVPLTMAPRREEASMTGRKDWDLHEWLESALVRGFHDIAVEHGLPDLQWELVSKGVTTEIVGRAGRAEQAQHLGRWAQLLGLVPIEDDELRPDGWAGTWGNIAMWLPPYRG